MVNVLDLICYVVFVALDIWSIADAGRCFSEKKWSWFGFNTFLAIYFMAEIIHLTFG